MSSNPRWASICATNAPHKAQKVLQSGDVSTAAHAGQVFNMRTVQSRSGGSDTLKVTKTYIFSLEV